MRKTKIIATMGPACSTEQELEKMVKSGLNVARFNMSHGDHNSHKVLIDVVKKVRDKLGVSLPIVIDTRGPEIRIRQFENGSVELRQKTRFILTTKSVLGNEDCVAVNYRKLPQIVGKGTKILIADGLIELRVLDKNDTDILCEVVVGGKLSNNKSINIPGVKLDLPYLSDIDKGDLTFAVQQGAQFVAISFVSNANDVKTVRNYLKLIDGERLKIISKIENQDGVDNIDAIIEASDGIMVARGDLGVEVPFERIPEIQKTIIRKCNEAGKLVITATEMLESMITNTRPTRAEISDVANAILDGTDAIMLSGETSVGAHPALVVSDMAKIAEMAEIGKVGHIDYSSFEAVKGDLTASVAFGACALASASNAKAIIAVTKSGVTAMQISRFKPVAPLLGCTPDEFVFHTLGAYYGVMPIKQAKTDSIDKLLVQARSVACEAGLVKKGDLVVQTAGKEINMSGSNMLILNYI